MSAPTVNNYMTLLIRPAYYLCNWQLVLAFELSANKPSNINNYESGKAPEKKESDAAEFFSLDCERLQKQFAEFGFIEVQSPRSNEMNRLYRRGRTENYIASSHVYNVILSYL